MPLCQKYLEGEEYIDILRRRFEEDDPGNAGFKDYCVTQIDERWEIVHLNVAEAGDVTYGRYGYTSFPLVYGIQDYGAMSAAGITQVREQPYLGLRGGGTLVGIIDTGIRYTHEAFVREDMSTTIEAIWDQTQQSGGAGNDRSDEENGNADNDIGKNGIGKNSDRGIEVIAPYGRVYTREKINEALTVMASSGNPLDIVPVTDVPDGHGTYMAGLAAGRENISGGFSGAAPDAGLVIVKLKQAKRYLRDFYFINDKALCYAETDIIFAIRFLNDYARLVNKPMSIIIGLGTNLSSHMGSSVLADYLDNIGRDIGRAVVTCAGNYANSRLHFSGNTSPEEEYTSVEIKVGSGERGFFCGLWSAPPEIFSLEFVSPTGRIERRIMPKVNEEITLKFPLEGTFIKLYNGINQAVSGLNFAIMRFDRPSSGIWTVRVYGENVLSGSFDMWISNKEFLWADTYFLKSDPYDTVTDPGNCAVPITVGAYDSRDGSIYIGSGRGDVGGGSVTGRIKPELVAPGVNVNGPLSSRDNAYGVRDGTSPAAAIAGGGAALILEYGIVRGFYPFLRTYTVKNYMVSGATRRDGFAYPDAVFGYGYLNIYGAVENVRKY